MKELLVTTAFMIFIAIASLDAAYADETQLVSVGQHKLEVSVRGKGENTIVFESGLGHDLSVWNTVADQVSQFARVVTYSRAGYGQSETSDQPRTLQQIATELDQLLIAKNVEPPYILVGHSAGGFYIRKYAELYPAKVEGFVFVDATPEQILVRLRKLDQQRAVEEEAVIESMTPDRVQPENTYFSKITASGKYPSTGSLPDVPAALITAMKQEFPQFLLHSIDGKNIWRDLQSNFISQFDDYLHIVSSTSGHDVHRHQPELVVSAIQYVIRQTIAGTTESEK